MRTARVQVRSRAGVPFEHPPRCRIPLEWIEIDWPLAELDALLRNRWIETRVIGDVPPIQPAVTNEIGVALRVRVRRGFEQVRFDVPSIGRLASVIDVPSEGFAAKLREDTRLDVRAHDTKLFPNTIFVRVSSKRGWVNSVHSFGENALAYELCFDDYSLLRFDARLDVEPLEPEALPPLTRVRIRSTTGKPFFRFGQHFQPDRWSEADLYPRELEELLACDHLQHEELHERAFTAPVDMPVTTEQSESHDPESIREIGDDAPLEADVDPEPGKQEATPALSPVDRIARWAERADVHRRARERGGFTVEEILAEALGSIVVARTRAFDMKLASTLRRIGWRRLPLQRRQGERVRPFVPPGQ